MKQLDIFDDSRDTMLANDLAAAIVDGRLDAARAAAAALAAEFPQDPRLPAAACLIEALAGGETLAFADAAAALAARMHLDTTLADAAGLVLGRDAPAWRAHRLRELGRRAARLPWQADRPLAHAAAFSAAASAWDETLAAVEAIASWPRQPQPLAWAAEARWRLSGPDAGWPLLAELAWLAPERAAALASRLADTRLTRLVAGFEAELDDEGFDWFPAWVLVEQPLLAAPLAAARPGLDRPPERGLRTLAALLRLERQGRRQEIVEQRRRLRDLHPALFACYMKTR